MFAVPATVATGNVVIFIAAVIICVIVISTVGLPGLVASFLSRGFFYFLTFGLVS